MLIEQTSRTITSKDHVLAIGKHKGKTIREVVEEVEMGRQYLEFMVDAGWLDIDHKLMDWILGEQD